LNLKSLDFGIGIFGRGSVGLDVVAQSGFFDEIVEVFLDLRGVALKKEADGAVGEVFDRSDKVEAFGQFFASVAEAHALDAAFEYGLSGNGITHEKKVF
jgi:hypothetical protein